ncbi:tetratricopeptide repeat protein [Foetidibacter luteolus]|uniref:tetratricopeptide repeat protein n=1 Tax=Foetidibacter luteolus TaxID=2608880 RepID=UPI00129A679D|nr:hypothetical protein [Foetidibacter luteolus]
MNKSRLYTVAILLLFSTATLAQEINGFKIFVSQSADTYVRFNSKITNWKFVGKDGYPYYSIQNVGEKGMMLSAKKEPGETYSLIVLEGGRQHKFFLVYKKDLSDDEMSYDYQNLDALKKLVQNYQPPAIEQPKAAEPATTRPAVTQPAVNQAVNNTPAITPVVTSNPETQYNELVTNANRAFNEKDYIKAKEIYLQADKLKPGQAWVTRQLGKIDELAQQQQQAEANAKNEKAYQDYITIADKDFTAGAFDAAKVGYNQALSIKPGDAYAALKIKQADQKISDQQAQAALNEKKKAEAQKKEAYQSLVNIANADLAKKDYESAKLGFEQALQQMPNDAYALSKLNEIEQLKKNAAKEAAFKQTKDAYNSQMQTGANYMNSQMFDDAVAAFQEALRLVPGDQEAQKMINKAGQEKKALAARRETERIEKEKNDKLNEVLNLANNAFEAGEYELAKTKYREALTLKPGYAPASEKLAAITKKEAEIVEQKNKEAKEAAEKQKYAGVIAKAEDAYTKQDYDAAISLYQVAASIKPAELLPKEKIEQLKAEKKAKEEARLLQEKIDRQYKAAMQKGDAAYKSNQFAAAEKAYAEAAQLKPAESIVATKLADVRAKLVEIARIEKLNRDYDEALQAGDSLAFKNNNLNAALVYFKKAVELKPGESFAQKRVAYTEKQLGIDSASLEAKRKQDIYDAEKVKLDEGLAYFKLGNEQVTFKKYEEALESYSKFLDTNIDTSIINIYKTNKYEINFARERVKGLYPIVEKIKASRKVEAPPPVEETKGKKKKKKS